MAKDGSGAAVGGGALYGLGIFGAWVYFWQQADSFWEYAFAVFQVSVLARVDGLRGIRRAQRLNQPTITALERAGC